MVEANLQAIIDARIAPMADDLRNLVVDIVRRCQSNVSQDYQRNQQLATASQPAPWTIQTQGLESIPTQSDSAVTHYPAMKMTHSAPDYFSEPNFVAAEASSMASIPMPTNSQAEQPNSDAQDSGYASLLDGCKCNCHPLQDTFGPSTIGIHRISNPFPLVSC